MPFVLRQLVTAVLVGGLGACLFASMRGEPDQASTTSVTSARIHASTAAASTAAPCLPIVVLRTARDDLDLPAVDRSNIGMIVGAAEVDARTLDRARAALLEGLARSVEAGDLDESLLAVLTDQMAWAASQVAPSLARALDDLYQLLTPEQRRALVERVVEEKLPDWSRTWAAGNDRRRWLAGWPDGEMPDFAGELARTSRAWAEKSIAHVSAVLPRLDPAERRALATSLRGEDAGGGED